MSNIDLRGKGITVTKWTITIVFIAGSVYASVRTVPIIEKLARSNEKSILEKVAAFHPEMAVHGRYREPCRECDAPIQRIVRGNHETNYCPGCQTGGKVLADRALSKLLKKDWPRSLEELEEKGMGKRREPR